MGRPTWVPTRTIDTNDYGTSTQLEGSLRTFKDMDYSTDPVTIRSQRDVICMCVRNVSGITLMSKRLVQFSTGFEGRRVDGYSFVPPSADSSGNFTGQPAAGVTDEFLPAGGVRNGDLFWIVVDGPTMCTSSATTAEIVANTMGALVNIATAATSQSTALGGRVQFVGITVADVAAATGGIMIDKIVNSVGRAKSVLAAASTDEDWLINIDLLKGG